MHADVLRQVESVVDADPAPGLLARIGRGDRAAKPPRLHPPRIEVAASGLDVDELVDTVRASMEGAAK